MAQQYDEGAEGSVTKNVSSTTTKTLAGWLEENRLSKILPYLESQEANYEDLFTYQEEDINAMWDDEEVKALKLGPLYKRRFLKALREIQFEASKSGTAAASGPAEFGQVYRIVISAEEQSAINEMESKVKELDEILKEITNQQSELTEDSKKKEMEIKETFNVFRNQLDDREKILTAKLSAETKRMGEELKTKENALKKYHETGSAALDQQNALILDPSIDSKKREIKIKEITNEAMQGMDDQHFQIKIHPILYSVDNDAISEFISAIGSVAANPAAPQVTISEISAFGAKVSLSTQDRNGEICYVVRYRKTIGNDDEKEEEWKEQEMEQKSDSMVIDGLQPASKYEICGRYQVNATSVWSQLSKMTLFTTLKRPPFQWDIARCGDGLTLSNENKIVTDNNNSTWRSVYSKNMISTATMSQLKFEITMRGKGGAGYLMIGIVNKNNIESASTVSYIGAQQHHQAFYVYDNYFPARYISTAYSRIKENRVSWNVGDRVRLDFDLKGRRCSVFLNDQLLGSLTDDLPESFHLAVSTCRQSTKLECTLFDIV